MPETSHRFPVSDYAHASKTEIAQELAEWFVTEHVAIPVYTDKQGNKRVYYQFVDEHGYWRKINLDLIESMAKDQIKRFWTRHTKQEFLNQFKAHEDHLFYDEMGLPENEVLCRNYSVYNIETGEIRIVDKSDMAMNMINADPEKKDVDISIFIDLVEDTLPEESHQKTFQEFLGWCLKYPNADYEKALIILGETDSGKSTLLKIVSKLFEHAQTSDISMSQLGHERTFHVHHMEESILNIDQDMSSAEITDSSTIKKLTSQEKQFVEPKGKDGFAINPTAKIMVASNVAPNPKTSNDKAIYNRFLTIEAPDRVPKEDQDKKLVDKCATEDMLSGIFHWALEGLKRLEDQGVFSHSPTITETRDKWDKYGSDIHKFLDQCVEFEAGSYVPTTDLYDCYELWSMERMGDTIGRKHFIAEMSKHPRMNKKRKRVQDGSSRMVFSNIKVSSDKFNL